MVRLVMLAPRPPVSRLVKQAARPEISPEAWRAAMLVVWAGNQRPVRAMDRAAHKRVKPAQVSSLTTQPASLPARSAGY